MTHDPLALYGLKFDPFTSETPPEALFLSPPVKRFIWRVDQLCRTGGFAMVRGAPGAPASRPCCA